MNKTINHKNGLIILIFLLPVLLCTQCVFANSDPSVSSVIASQRDDESSKVDIYYTLNDDDGDKCNVSIRVSDDAGISWGVTVSPTSLSGDIGADIIPGRKHIIWTSKDDLPGVFGISYRVEVSADDSVLLIAPDIVGLSQSDAEAAIIGAGLVVGIVTEVYNETIAKGNIISQDPIGGEEVAAGSAVNLTISLGPDVGSDGVVFVPIPSGSFQMGDSFYEAGPNERPVHTVTLSPFQISKYEITNAQYCIYLNLAYPAEIKVVDGIVYDASDELNMKPYCDLHSYNGHSQIDFSDGIFTVSAKGERSMINDPVVAVSWYGAKAFCDYYGYNLPTEAQWEYAARGGLSGKRFPWGDTISHRQANYRSFRNFDYDTNLIWDYHRTWDDDIKPYTSPVGSFSPNGYGLYDMSGNVAEYCFDWLDPGYYSVSPRTDPTGPRTGVYRIMRGGSWSTNPGYCRVSNRYYNTLSSWRPSDVGFRVCLGSNLSHPNISSGESNTFIIDNRDGVSSLIGIVTGIDSEGIPLGPLEGAKVSIAGENTISDSEGQFSFSDLPVGINFLTAEKNGYYPSSKGVTLEDGETNSEIIKLTIESVDPTAYDIKSLNGKHIIEGIPGNLTFIAMVVWNGSQGNVSFKINGNYYPADIEELVVSA